MDSKERWIILVNALEIFKTNKRRLSKITTIISQSLATKTEIDSNTYFGTVRQYEASK